MEFKDLVEKLATLGFSNYEAKAYISLLKQHPVTGYELAKSSGIPPSKIYEVLGKLLERSVISPISGKTTKYTPQDNRVFLNTIRTEFQETIDYVEKYLPTIENTGAEYVWNVNEMQDFISKAKSLILHAQNDIILLGWDEELRILLPMIKESSCNKIAIIQFGTMAIDVGVVYDHGIEKVLEREKGGRILTLVTDSSSLIQGIISQSSQIRGIYTSHPSLVELAIDYMKHEIYTAKMYDHFSTEMDQTFKKDLRKLRDIWTK